MAPARPFLTARCEHLVLLSYPCPPSLLAPLMPAGTELDAWQGETLISLVGFLFADTRLEGMPIPCHRTFEEVHRRVYVRRRLADGTVRRVYNEPFLAVPMSHDVSLSADHGGAVTYGWRHAGASFDLHAQVSGAA